MIAGIRQPYLLNQTERLSLIARGVLCPPNGPPLDTDEQVRLSRIAYLKQYRQTEKARRAHREQERKRRYRLKLLRELKA